MHNFPSRFNRHFRAHLVAIMVLAAMFLGNTGSAALWLPRSLSDHVLFQQGEPIVLWGKATPGARVSVQVSEEGKAARIRTGQTRADSDSAWRVVLNPMSASFTQYVIEVNGDGEARSIRDVLVGELWLVGGQSNMHLPVRYILGGEDLMKQAKQAAIRIFYQDTVDESWRDRVSETPMNDTPNGRWMPANSPKNVSECSAVAYTYALALFDSLNKDGRTVPVGVMNTAVGATGITSWTSRDALLKDPILVSTLPARWNEGKWSQYHKPWNQATALFNHKIAPLTNHAVRGFLWYQGENDANGGEDGAAFYKTALTNLITDWRGHWGGRPRSFILVQLHAYDREGQVAPAKLENWAYLREAQIEAADAVPQTVAVPIHDLPLTWNIGDFSYKSPIHPLDKRPIGERLALVARAIAYGEPLEFRGPAFKQMIVNGDQAIIHFSQAEGLKARGDALLGFTICGSDRRFAEAQARIEGDRVIASSPLVKQPVAVAYAFTGQNHCANLFNRYDLPAAPFRTDKTKSEFLKGCTTRGSEAPVRLANETGIDKDRQIPPTNAIVHVDASQVVVKRTNSLIGANLEDLNSQLYGGLYSQLLYGENFEEHVDPTELLGLSGLDRMKIWVVLDEHGQPLLRAFRGHPYSPSPYRLRRVYEALGPDWLSSSKRDNERDIIGGLAFIGGVVLPSELPEGKGQALIALATGPDQISRHWRKVRTGSATGSFTLVRQGVWNGKQSQRITFGSGTGELGIDNAGLYRQGIPLAGQRGYEGVLRIQSDEAQEIWASLRAADGTVLAEQAIALIARPGEFQRVAFVLTPNRADVNGRFALALKRPGTITVDYAFLQPGDWGRFHGLPVLKDRAEAVLSMGVKTARLNGSMVNKCPDGPTSYKWKQMIAPRDQRQPYHGWFNPYATHGFAIFELLDFCKAAGLEAIIGLRTDETEQDVADLIEFCRGGPETPWGKRRHESGHQDPYVVTAVQIGNEQAPDQSYVARFKALASALWAKDRTLNVLASVNVGDHFTGKASPGGIDVMRELVTWVRSQGQEERFVLDSHYGSQIGHADADLDAYVGLRFHDALATALPGFNLRLWPMEENGGRHDWSRGLAHAHNLNTMNRMPDCLERAGTANTIEPWNMAILYNQARIHFTSSQIIFQPSYHVDRIFGDEWLPLVVRSQSSLDTLDVTAKKNEQENVLTVYLVNIAEQPVATILKLKGFTPQSAQVVRLHANDLTVRNTPDHPKMLAPETLPWTWKGPETGIDIPGYSFTSIRMVGAP